MGVNLVSALTRKVVRLKSRLSCRIQLAPPKASSKLKEEGDSLTIGAGSRTRTREPADYCLGMYRAKPYAVKAMSLLLEEDIPQEACQCSADLLRRFLLRRIVARYPK